PSRSSSPRDLSGALAPEPHHLLHALAGIAQHDVEDGQSRHELGCAVLTVRRKLRLEEGELDAVRGELVCPVDGASARRIQEAGPAERLDQVDHACGAAMKAVWTLRTEPEGHIDAGVLAHAVQRPPE